jgi:hypothetical protein
MSTSGSSDETVNETMVFADLLSQNAILLEKSQLPGVREKKKEAIARVIKAYHASQGKKIDEKQIFKRISNLKARLRKKTDKNRTGNRRIKIQPWENQLLHLMKAEENPVFNKLPGKLLGLDLVVGGCIFM